MRELTIAGTRIHDGGDCYVIAEIGHNHQGELERAKQLVDAAAECGVDAVKFQKRDNRRLFTSWISFRRWSAIAAVCPRSDNTASSCAS
jgi:sialic acid synthase SpsE